MISACARNRSDQVGSITHKKDEAANCGLFSSSVVFSFRLLKFAVSFLIFL